MHSSDQANQDPLWESSARIFKMMVSFTGVASLAGCDLRAVMDNSFYYLKVDSLRKRKRHRALR